MQHHPHPEIGEITLTGVLAALGDPVRLEMVSALVEGERGSSEFDCAVSNSTRSHHIRTLREAGVILHRKEGTRCYVSIRPELHELFPGLLESVVACARREKAA
jgi:DNA-binding transcriptional ArsR family regulator